MNDLFEVNARTCQCVLLGGSGVPQAGCHQPPCALLLPGPADYPASAMRRPSLSLRHMHLVAILSAFRRFGLMPRSSPAWIKRRLG